MWDEDFLRRFATNVKDHTIKCLKNDGLYRHYSCTNNGSSIYRFDIITWPGYMAIVGDMGDYVFAREKDMFPFMQTACRSHTYAAEKCVSISREGIRLWDREGQLNEIRLAIQEYKEYNNESAKKLEKLLYTLEDIDNEHEFHKELWEAGFGDSVTWCYKFTFHFLWILKAIDWFFEKNNETKTEQTV